MALKARKGLVDYNANPPYAANSGIEINFSVVER